jgi:hypothetical protein
MPASPSLNGKPMSDATRGRRPSPWIVVLGVLLALPTPIGTGLAVSYFLPVFSGFGAELPVMTVLVVNHYALLWLLPVLTLAMGVLPHMRLWGPGPPRMAGLVSLCLLPVLVVLLYLPIFRLGAAV